MSAIASMHNGGGHNEVAALSVLCEEAKRLVKPVHVGRDDGLLAWRYIIRRDPEGCVYIHNWMRSDPDDLHDHPWPFSSLILRGGYWEVTPYGRRWREVGSTSHLNERDLHRVELHPGVTDVWSMIVTGQKKKSWGFMVGDKIVPWRQYQPSVLVSDAKFDGECK